MDGRNIGSATICGRTRKISIGFPDLRHSFLKPTWKRSYSRQGKKGCSDVSPFLVRRRDDAIAPRNPATTDSDRTSIEHQRPRRTLLSYLWMEGGLKHVGFFQRRLGGSRISPPRPQRTQPEAWCYVWVYVGLLRIAVVCGVAGMWLVFGGWIMFHFLGMF